MDPPEEEWKEYLSLKGLTERIPQQFQSGFNISHLNLTCLDAFQDHLVIGTNVGLLYLAHLPTFNINKLKCENALSSLQVVSALRSVEDLIAAGCYNGYISIFLIPHALLKNLTSQDTNTLNAASESPSTERFTLHYHKAPLTSLTWSRNGMKLFSGDLLGNIGVVNVDYDKRECTCECLFSVSSRVIQLSYSHQMLAVSYDEWCLIYDCRNYTKKFVGKKPRNPPGFYGCTFAPGEESPNEDILYCARPGQRIWSANIEGIVQFSYIQTKLPDHCVIQLEEKKPPRPRKSKLSFGLLHHIRGAILASASCYCLTILDVARQKTFGYCDSFHKICDIAVSGENIFILDDNRSIICISSSPPAFGSQRHFATFSLLPKQENLNLPSLAELRSKVPVLLPNNQLIDGITRLGESFATKLSEIAAPTVISGNKASENYDKRNTDLEAQDEKAPIYAPRPYSIGFPRGVTFQNEKRLYQSIDNNTEELEKKDRPTCTEKTKTEVSDVADCERERNYDVVVSLKQKRKVKATENENFEAPVRSFNDDSRPYEDFKEKIEENESFLADILDLKCLKMDHVTGENLDDGNAYAHHLHKSLNSLEECNSVDNAQFSPPSSHNLQSNASTPNTSLSKQEIQNLKNPERTNRDLSYGPPSGSSTLYSSDEAQLHNLTSITSFSSDSINTVHEGTVSTSVIEDLMAPNVNTMPPAEELVWGWQKHLLPSKPSGFCGSGNSVYISEGKNLHFSNDFYSTNKNLPSWKRKKLLTGITTLSSYEQTLLLQTITGQLLSIELDHLVSNMPVCGHDITEDDDIKCSAIDQGVLWTLHNDGKVRARPPGKVIDISCQELRLTTLVCRSGVVWGLTTSGRIAYRIGVGPNLPTGVEWGVMLLPNPVKCIHVSANGCGWMMDSTGALYVCLYVSQSYPQGLDAKWWQIGMSDYMFDDTNHDNRKLKEETAQILITSNDHYLWVAQNNSAFAFTHSVRSFVGHRWHCFGLDKFVSLSGEGVFRSRGFLYCADAKGDLFAISSDSQEAVPIHLPNREKIASFSSRPEALWALTKSGNIFIRTGLSRSSRLGLKWAKLDLHQIADVQLKHISLSAEVVWAVDTSGKVYIRQGPLDPPKPKHRGLDPAWLHVDSNELKNGAVFDKVCVGNKSHLVWGIDTAHRIYVREAIFPELSTGTSWVLVPGILGQSISISEDRVFVVSPILNNSACGGDAGTSGSTGEASTGGLLFEREGITSMNYIGDSWKRIPTHSTPLTCITASVDNCLWALDQRGSIQKHTKLSLFDVGLESNYIDEGALPSSDNEDWDII